MQRNDIISTDELLSSLLVRPSVMRTTEEWSGRDGYERERSKEGDLVCEDILTPKQVVGDGEPTYMIDDEQDEEEEEAEGGEGRRGEDDEVCQTCSRNRSTNTSFQDNLCY